MSQAQHSRTHAGTLPRSRPRTGKEIPRGNPTSTRGPSRSYLSLNVAHARVVVKLRRAASVLEADDGRSLPQVSVNDLERAVSTFLEEVRLGLPREGTSTNRTSSSGDRSYGSKLQLEIKDPERAKRVRANRKQVEVEILEKMKARGK